MDFIIYLVVASCCAALFRMGGADGFSKAYRRYGVPTVILAFLLLNNVDALKALAICAGLSATLHLGYGEGRDWWIRYTIMVSYVLPSIWLGHTHMQWITPAVAWSLFYLSNAPVWRDIIVWKDVEMSIGAMVGMTYVSAVL